MLDVFPESSETKVYQHKVSPISLSLKEPYSTHIYRIIQELLTNNIKHSKATNTIVNITLENANLELKYTDNGVGNKNISKGNGLKNITDRVLLMNGNLDINTEAEKGFSVVLKIPYNA